MAIPLAAADPKARALRLALFQFLPLVCVCAPACGVVAEPYPVGAGVDEPASRGEGGPTWFPLLSPVDKQVVGATLSVVIAADFGNAKLQKVALACGGVDLGSQAAATSTAQKFAFAFSLQSLPEGAAECTLTAHTTAGQRSLTRSLIVDRTAPKVTMVASPTGPVISKALLQVKSEDKTLASVRIKLGEIVLAQTGPLVNWAPTVLLPPLNTGPAILVVEAADKAGNANAVAVPISVVAAPAFEAGASPFMQAPDAAPSSSGAPQISVPLMVDGHAADMDGDGHLDILVATNLGITICYGDGKGGFVETPVYAGEAAHWVRALPLPPATVAGFAPGSAETGRWALALIGAGAKVRVVMALAVQRKLALVAEHPLPGAKGKAELLSIDGKGALVAVLDGDAADPILRTVRIEPPAEVNWSKPTATVGSAPVVTVKSQPGVGNVARVRVADMDGDSNLDLVLGRDGPSVVTVCLNDGQFGFSNCKDALIAGETRPLDALPVVPKTGKGLDLLVVGNASASLFYLRNNGVGQFNVVSRAALASPPKGLYPLVAVGAVPGQPGTQAAVLCEGNAVSTLALDDLANGTNLDLTLACRAGRIASGQPAFAIVGDYNGDGLPDLVVANANEPGADLFDSNVAVNQAYDYPLCLRHKAQKGMTPAGLAVADFEGDGKPDLLLVGNAAPSANYACGNTTDLDNGPRDLAVPLELYRNVGYTGNKVPTYTEYAPNVDGVSIPNGIACGSQVRAVRAVHTTDFDGDGRRDLALLFQGAYPMVQGGGCVWQEANEVDGKLGLPDSACLDEGYAASIGPGQAAPYARTTGVVLRNHPQKGFGFPTDIKALGKALPPRLSFAAGIDPIGFALGDLDGDAKDDWVTILPPLGDPAAAQFLPPRVRIFRNSGAAFVPVSQKGTFTVTPPGSTKLAQFAGSWLPTGLGAIAGVAGPAGKGGGQLHVVNQESHDVTSYNAISALSLQAPAVLHAVGANPRAIALRDVDGDAHRDVVVARDGWLWVGKGSAAGTVASASTLALPKGEVSALTVGDFNGDGLPDIAVAYRTLNRVALVLADGKGAFAVVEKMLYVNQEPVELVALDVNGDGIDDLAARCLAGRSVTVQLTSKPAWKTN